MSELIASLIEIALHLISIIVETVFKLILIVGAAAIIWYVLIVVWTMFSLLFSPIFS